MNFCYETNILLPIIYLIGLNFQNYSYISVSESSFCSHITNEDKYRSTIDKKSSMLILNLIIHQITNKEQQTAISVQSKL